MKLEENQQTHSSKVLDVPTAKMPHIQLPENLGIRYAVLPGDPARAERAAGYLKDAKLLAWNREYKSYSGFWNGVPVLVMSTGCQG